MGVVAESKDPFVRRIDSTSSYHTAKFRCQRLSLAYLRTCVVLSSLTTFKRAFMSLQPENHTVTYGGLRYLVSEVMLSLPQNCQLVVYTTSHSVR